MCALVFLVQAIEYTKSPLNIDIFGVVVQNTTGPGPIKSDRGHAHRFSPHYHSHASRRVSHPPRQFNRYDSESGVERPSHPAERPYDSSAEQHEEASRYSSMDYQHHRGSLSSPTQAPLSHQDPHSPPLLRVLYPNLTLTLALIYVDRLKAVSISSTFFVCSVAAHCELWAFFWFMLYLCMTISIHESMFTHTALFYILQNL